MWRQWQATAIVLFPHEWAKGLLMGHLLNNSFWFLERHLTEGARRMWNGTYIRFRTKKYTLERRPFLAINTLKELEEFWTKDTETWRNIHCMIMKIGDKLAVLIMEFHFH